MKLKVELVLKGSAAQKANVIERRVIMPALISLLLHLYTTDGMSFWALVSGSK